MRMHTMIEISIWLYNECNNGGGPHDKNEQNYGIIKKERLICQENIYIIINILPRNTKQNHKKYDYKAMVWQKGM